MGSVAAVDVAVVAAAVVVVIAAVVVVAAATAVAVAAVAAVVVVAAAAVVVVAAVAVVRKEGERRWEASSGRGQGGAPSRAVVSATRGDVHVVGQRTLVAQRDVRVCVCVTHTTHTQRALVNSRLRAVATRRRHRVTRD